MLNIFSNRLLLALLFLFSHSAIGSENAYQVELVIFTTHSLATVPSITNTTKNEMATAETLDKESTQTIYPLAQHEFKLNRLIGKLKQSQHTILFHQAWVVKNLLTQNESIIINQLDTPEQLANNLVTPSLSGTIDIQKKNGFKLSIKLNYTANCLNSDMKNSSTCWYTVKESRGNIKEKELNYFDSEHLGVLIEVFPIDVKEKT